MSLTRARLAPFHSVFSREKNSKIFLVKNKNILKTNNFFRLISGQKEEEEALCPFLKRERERGFNHSQARVN
jgi:hypothetical protein